MKYINNEIEKLDKKRNDIFNSISHPKAEGPSKFKDVIFEKLSLDEKKLVVSQFIEKIMIFEAEIEIVWNV
jgi:hypothetical protein